MYLEKASFSFACLLRSVCFLVLTFIAHRHSLLLIGQGEQHKPTLVYTHCGAISPTGDGFDALAIAKLVWMVCQKICHSFSLSSPEQSCELFLTRMKSPPRPVWYTRRLSISACFGYHPLGFWGRDIISPDVLQGSGMDTCFPRPQDSNHIGPLVLPWQSSSRPHQHTVNMNRCSRHMSRASVDFGDNGSSGHVEDTVEDSIGRRLYVLGQSCNPRQMPGHITRHIMMAFANNLSFLASTLTSYIFSMPFSRYGRSGKQVACVPSG